jgi:hypothetical protein
LKKKDTLSLNLDFLKTKSKISQQDETPI